MTTTGELNPPSLTAILTLGIDMERRNYVSATLCVVSVNDGRRKGREVNAVNCTPLGE